jgi:V/A-type H+-transporting ATPase subunit I
MNIIGSFIHPARLMFLEFFGRFYEGGGVPFKPFAHRYDALEILGKE